MSVCPTDSAYVPITYFKNEKPFLRIKTDFLKNENEVDSIVQSSISRPPTAARNTQYLCDTQQDRFNWSVATIDKSHRRAGKLDHLMQRILFLLALTSIFANYCSSFTLNPRRFYVSSRVSVRKSITLSAKPEEVISNKMSKSKVKTESVEIDYDVTRSSGFVLQGITWSAASFMMTCTFWPQTTVYSLRHSSSFLQTTGLYWKSWYVLSKNVLIMFRISQKLRKHSRTHDDKIFHRPYCLN